MEKFTQIIMVLDRSGSMENIKHDTIGGFNQFLEDQKKLKGNARMTLVLFDDQYEVIFAEKNLKDIEKLNDTTFVPRGLTRLLDAMGKTINMTYSKIKSMKKKDRPEQVVFVVITDGRENDSKEFTREAVFNMVNEMKEKENWQFMFLGANQDAIQESGQYGFDAGSSLSYSATSKGVQTSYTAVSDRISYYRSTGQLLNFTEEDRKNSMENNKDEDE